MRSSQEKAQAAILYHATQGRIVTNKIKDSEVVMSLDEENPLRLSVYRKAVGVECAVVEKADMEGQNGVIHVVNRVMIAANISAGDLLRREGNFKSVFVISLKAQSWKTKQNKKQDVPESYGAGDDGKRRPRLVVRRSLVHFLRADGRRFWRAGRVDDPRRFEKSRPFENGQLRFVFFPPELCLKRWRSQIVANHVVPGLFNSDSFRPHLIYKLPSLFGTLAVQRTEKILKV